MDNHHNVTFTSRMLMCIFVHFGAIVVVTTLPNDTTYLSSFVLWLSV